MVVDERGVEEIVGRMLGRRLGVGLGSLDPRFPTVIPPNYLWNGGRISVPFGTASDLSIRGVGDPNSGLAWLSAGDILIAVTNGVERLRIANAGVTIPVGTLTVSENSITGGVFIGSDGQIYRSAVDKLRTPDALQVDGQLTAALNGVAGGLAIGTDGLIYRVTADVLRTPDSLIVDGAGTVSGVLTASNAANVIRIGTSSDLTTPPAMGGVTPNTGKFSTLETTGIATIAGRTTIVATVAGNNVLLVDNPSATGFGMKIHSGGIAGEYAFRITDAADSATLLEIISNTGVVKQAAGSAAAPSMAYVDEVGLGLYRAAAGSLGFAVGGAQMARLNATGFYPGNQTTRYFGATANELRSYGDHQFVNTTGTVQWGLINATGFYPGNQSTRYIADDATYMTANGAGLKLQGAAVELLVIEGNSGTTGSAQLLFRANNVDKSTTYYDMATSEWRVHHYGAATDVFQMSASGLQINGGGVKIGVPTGSFKGVGTLNLAGDAYKNDSAYTNPDYVLEHYWTGKIERFKNNEGAASYQGLMPLRDVREFTQLNLRLPGIADAPMGIFERGDVALRQAEELYLHLFELEARVADLERTQGAAAAATLRSIS